jgi:hypothetical protein
MVYAYDPILYILNFIKRVFYAIFSDLHIKYMFFYK